MKLKIIEKVNLYPDNDTKHHIFFVKVKSPFGFWKTMNKSNGFRNSDVIFKSYSDAEEFIYDNLNLASGEIIVDGNIYTYSSYTYLY